MTPAGPGLALLLAAILATVNFLSEKLDERMEGFRVGVVSFSAGVTISYIFLQLLPEFLKMASENTLTFTFPLVGFSVFHVSEKYLKMSDMTGEQLKKEYAELHLAFFLLYHGAMGYLLASLLEESLLSGLLFFTPFTLHLAVSSLSLNELHHGIRGQKVLRALAALSPVLGVIAFWAGAPETLFLPLLGTLLGMFLYIAVRDSIPEGEKGKPLEFLAGAALYLALIAAATTI